MYIRLTHEIISYTTDVNQKFTAFIDIFQNTLNKHAPYRSVTRKEAKLAKKLWITPASLKSIKTKNKLYLLQLRYPFDEPIAKRYKSYKKKLVHLKELAKKMYYNSIFDYNKNDNKKTWRVINEILSNKHQKNSNNIPLKITDEYNRNHEDPIAIRNVFNTYFAKDGSTLASKIPAPTINKMQNMHSVVDSFFLRPITETEVAHLLRNLDSSKSTGLHHIPIKYLKMATTVVAPILTDMHNCCIQEGVYPDVLKIAQIIPVYKKGNKSSCTNYRPIFLLSINKIFEKLIYNHLENYLTKKKLLTDNNQ